MSRYTDQATELRAVSIYFDVQGINRKWFPLRRKQVYKFPGLALALLNTPSQSIMEKCL